VVDQIIEWLAQGTEVTGTVVIQVLGNRSARLRAARRLECSAKRKPDRIVRLLRIKGAVERMFHGKVRARCSLDDYPKARPRRYYSTGSGYD